MRVTGAVFLAKSGVDIWRIQALGRWGSEAIRLYLRNSHVQSLGNVTAEAQIGRSLELAKAELLTLQAKARELGAAVEAEHENRTTILSSGGHNAVPVTDSDLLDNEVRGNENEQVVEPSPELELVVNKNGPGRLHIIRVGDCNTPPRLWRTKCGWQFGLAANAEKTNDWGAATMCPTCFALNAQGRDEKGCFLANNNNEGDATDQYISNTSSSSSSDSSDS